MGLPDLARLAAPRAQRHHLQAQPAPVMIMHLEPWSSDDLPLLQALQGSSIVMAHLGGPESLQEIRKRQVRYERLDDVRIGRMFKIVTDVGEPAGSVGYWEKEWREEMVYETGWMILPRFQGLGFATTAATAVIEKLRDLQHHRWLHAFPSVENVPSNTICRKLGFELVGPCDFEYPAGHLLRCNDWRFDLRP